MKPASFQYHAPSMVEECLDLLTKYSDDASLLAGGQSLVPLMRFRLAQPSQVISLRSIAALRSIRIENAYLVIGANVTYAEAQRSADAMAACPGLGATIALIATPAIRNRGTVCGNLCQADPASELPAFALAMHARMRLCSSAGERILSAEEFFLGPYTTARRSDEVLAEVQFPVRQQEEAFAIREVSRLRGGFPMAGVAVALTRGAGGSLRSVAIACFGVHAKQIRVPAAEAALVASGYTPQGVSNAADMICAIIEPHTDAFASAEYRRSAFRVLLHQAMDEVCEPRGGRL